MNNPGTIEQLLFATRIAALREGLAELVRIHIRVGPDASCTGEDLIQELSCLFHGPLLGGCRVTCETAPTGGFSLASIEGFPPARTTLTE